MTFLRWAPFVLSVELKKAFSYRVDFWIQFVIGTCTDLCVAYFLWKAMFAAKGATTMQGYSLTGLVFYYLFASFSVKITRGAERGYMAQEIYDGGLTRYLLYPLPFLPYKYVTHVSQQLLSSVQLILAFALLFSLAGLPADQNISWQSLLSGTLTCLLAGYLHFMMTSCIELIAFWQDVIWNLSVMLRFLVGMLGGGMIPLAFFPDWAKPIIHRTPFPLLIDFPVRTFLGQISWAEWGQQMGWLVFWSLILSVVLSQIWARGTKQYTGVGI